MNLGNDEIEMATDGINALQKPATYHEPEEPDYTWVWGTCCVSIFIIIAVLFGGMYFKHRHEKLREEQRQQPSELYMPVAEYPCPVCGAKVSDFALFCPVCGSTLTEKGWRQPERTPSSIEIPVERETEPVTFESAKELKLIKIRCPVCKHEMEIEDTGRPLKIMCEKCGAKGTLR